MAFDPGTQQTLQRGFDFGRRFRADDSTRFAASAGRNLDLYETRPVERRGHAGRRRKYAARHRHPGRMENFLGIVFEDQHLERASYCLSKDLTNNRMVVKKKHGANNK